MINNSIYLIKKGNLTYITDTPSIIKNENYNQEKFEGISTSQIFPFFKQAIKNSYRVFSVNSNKVINFPSTNYFFVRDLIKIVKDALN